MPWFLCGIRTESEARSEEISEKTGGKETDKEAEEKKQRKLKVCQWKQGWAVSHTQQQNTAAKETQEMDGMMV